MQITGDAHRFFATLEQDPGWWRAHRDLHRDAVERPLTEVLAWGSERFGGAPKLFRAVLDQRFARDGARYRTEAVGGLGGPDDPAVRYLRVDATGTWLGAGAPRPPREHLQAVRRRIDASPEAAAALTALLDELPGEGFALPDDPLRTAPRGWTAEHPRIDLLRRRAFAAERHFAPGALGDPTRCEQELEATWSRLDGLVAWLREAVA